MMDGRVKTLHPALHGGILARRDRPDDLPPLARHGIGLVDLVVVNLYPFAEAAPNPATPFDALVEEIDIGGPSLVRAAAKNFRDVLVVVDPGRLSAAARSRSTRRPSLAFRFELMREGLRAHGDYDTAIAATLRDGRGRRRPVRTGGTPADGGLPPTVELGDHSICRSRRSAICGTARTRTRRPPGTPSASFAVRASAARRSCRARNCRTPTSSTSTRPRASRSSSTEPAAVVIKHTNPCGAAIGSSAGRRVSCARATPTALAAFGGIVALNRPIDVATAHAIVSTFIEAVIAPAVDDAARAILATKANMRVVTADFTALDDAAVDVRVDSRRDAVAGTRRRGRGAPRRGPPARSPTDCAS